MKTTLVLTIYLVLIPNQSDALDVTEELKICARTEDDVTRAACYEALGKRVLEVEATESSATTGPVVETSDEVLPDDIGGDSFAKKAGVEQDSSRGLVTSCKKAADGKWFYIFENGQIWKQVNSRRRRHKECNFYVGIVRDAFGYKMKIDGEDRIIRIRRHR